MTCSATSSNGSPCKMAALRGGSKCWAHDETKAAARDEARRRGAAKTNGRHERVATPTSESPAPLSDLGDLRFETRADIRDALVKVAKGLASGTLPTARARALIEVLQSADRVFEDAPVDPKVPPPGARVLTNDEHRFIIENGGRFPPGVQPVERLRDRPWSVEGPVWTPPPAEGEPGSN